MSINELLSRRAHAKSARKRRWLSTCAIALLATCLIFLRLGQAAAEARTVNVRDKGAVGDGVTDDSTALQSAFDAMADSGGTIYIPAGRYRITRALQLQSLTRVHGDGAATVLFCDPQGWKLVTTESFGMFTIRGGHSIEISSMLFRSTVTAEQTMTPKFIYLEQARQINIHDNEFEDAGFEGLWQGGKPEETQDLIVSRNMFRNVGRPAGPYVGLPAIQVNAYTAIISDNILRDVGTGIGASGSKITVANNRIEGVEVAGIGTGDGGPQSGLVIAGNTIFLSSKVQSARVGILVEPIGAVANPVLVSGNLIHVDGQAEHASSVGIRVVKGAAASLVGNVLTVRSKGSGIEVLGHTSPTTVMLSANSVHVLDERAAVFGIAGNPHGRAQRLSVVSVGNTVTGTTAAAGSFAIDFNTGSGGTLVLNMRNDFAGSGFVRLGTEMNRVESGSGRFFEATR
jgi:Pectate lyase superfamily protein